MFSRRSAGRVCAGIFGPHYRSRFRLSGGPCSAAPRPGGPKPPRWTARCSVGVLPRRIFSGRPPAHQGGVVFCPACPVRLVPCRPASGPVWRRARGGPVPAPRRRGSLLLPAGLAPGCGGPVPCRPGSVCGWRLRFLLGPCAAGVRSSARLPCCPAVAAGLGLLPGPLSSGVRAARPLPSPRREKGRPFPAAAVSLSAYLVR